MDTRHDARRAYSRLERTAFSSPPIGADEERALARAAHGGSATAFERLVSSHMRLVFAMAAEYRRYGTSLSDLISEGMLGLVCAARRFDPDRGVRLAAYAAHRIRAHLRRYTLKTRRMVGPPSSRAGRALLGRLGRTERELTERLGRTPDREAVAEHLGVAADVVAEVQVALRARDAGVASTDERTTDTYEPISLEPSPEALAAENEVRSRAHALLARGLETLGPRERAILSRRHLQPEPTTFNVLARSLGVSCERVRQLEARGYERLRQVMLQSVA